MTIRDVLVTAAKLLQPKRITCAADHDLGRLEAEILLAHVLKKDRAWLHAHPEKVLSAQYSVQLKKLIARRRKHEPIAYILGEKEFYGLPFFVDRRALIPRPESELLVDLSLNALFPEPSSHDLVWDVGTGSGAIAIAIAKEIEPRRVLATDISTSALTLAKKNATRHKANNVTFLKADLLDVTVRRFLNRYSPTRLLAYQPRLIITANLPYLPLSDKKRLDPDVVRYEPANALFTTNGGLALIEKFLRQLASFDVHFTSAFLEFDPPQAKKLRALARSLFPNATIKIHKDLARRNRVMEIQR